MEIVKIILFLLLQLMMINLMEIEAKSDLKPAAVIITRNSAGAKATRALIEFMNCDGQSTEKSDDVIKVMNTTIQNQQERIAELRASNEFLREQLARAGQREIQLMQLLNPTGGCNTSGK